MNNIDVENRFLNSRRGGWKTCIGRGMGVLRAQGTLRSYASTTRTVRYERPVARTEEVLLTVASAYSSRSLAQTSTNPYSTPGTR